jgi:hypothetical protein
MVDLASKNGVFHSYVSLPQGNMFKEHGFSQANDSTNPTTMICIIPKMTKNTGWVGKS